MTLDDAQQLAKLVEDSGDWIPIAIGRFIVPEELQAACAGGYLHKVPWMVAITAVGNVRSRTKLTCHRDWQDLIRCAPVVHSEVEAGEPAPNGMLF